MEVVVIIIPKWKKKKPAKTVYNAMVDDKQLIQDRKLAEGVLDERYSVTAKQLVDKPCVKQLMLMDKHVYKQQQEEEPLSTEQLVVMTKDAYLTQQLWTMQVCIVTQQQEITVVWYQLEDALHIVLGKKPPRLQTRSSAMDFRCIMLSVDLVKDKLRCTLWMDL